METLGHWELRRVCQCLSRVDCIQWSRVSRQWHAQLQELCHLRLTESQAQIVDKLLALRAADWTRSLDAQSAIGQGLEPYLEDVRFPSQFTLSTGPSTGKTLVTLYASGALLRRGQPSFIVAPLRLVPQWCAEHAKFQRDLALPPLLVAHPSHSADWRARLEREPQQLVLVPSSVVRSDGDLLPPLAAAPISPAKPTPTQRTLLELWGCDWAAAFCDEQSAVPNVLFRYSLAHRGRFFAVTLNASAGQRKRKLGELEHEAAPLAAYTTDRDLGALPRVQTRLDLAMPSPHSIRFKAWLLGCLEAECGKKTIVLSDARARRDSRGSKRHALELDAAELGRLEARFGKVYDAVTTSGPERAAAVQAFASASSGLLLGGLRYLARGFNLHIDTAIVLDADASVGVQLLLQLRGRVRRAESPFAKVQLCLHVGAAQLDQAPLLARHLAFHGLVQSERTTDALLGRVRWFESLFALLPYHFRAKQVRRQGALCQLTSIARDKSFASMCQAFAALFPNDNLTVAARSPTLLEFTE